MACPALYLPGPCSRCQRHTSSFFDDGTACPSSSVLNGGGLSPARRRQRAVIPELDCRTEPQIARRSIAAVIPVNTLQRARHLNSFASTPIRKVFTPCPITIVLFT